MGSKTREEIERLNAALDDDDGDDDPPALRTDDLVGAARSIDVAAWANEIRARVAKAQAADLEARIAEARAGYERESRELSARKLGPVDPSQQDVVINELLARVPPDRQASLNWFNYERATVEEKAELIKSLRHLLGDEDGVDE